MAAPDAGDVLARLTAVLRERLAADPDASYTARLHRAGLPAIAAKIVEEAGETAAAAAGPERELVHEVADVWFHTLVLLAAVVFTDIRRDGMLEGVNAEATAALARELTTPVIASGGVASLDDLRALRARADDGIAGVIIGRALYEERIDLRAALALAAG